MTKHLLSETATWSTKSEFVTPNGQASEALGESVITVNGDTTTNMSWVEINGKRLMNNYHITRLPDNHFDYQSDNPDLGIQQGRFDISQNTVFSRFTVLNTDLNGYEIISREKDLCFAKGALYNGNELINTWNAVMTKKV